MSESANDDMKMNLGEIGVAFGDGPQKGRIVVALPAMAKAIVMNPEQAVMVAKDIIDKAVSLGVQVQILIPKKPISQSRRTLIVNRIDIVMRKLQERKRPSRYIAEELVDIVLRDSGA